MIGDRVNDVILVNDAALERLGRQFKFVHGDCSFLESVDGHFLNVESVSVIGVGAINVIAADVNDAAADNGFAQFIDSELFCAALDVGANFLERGGLDLCHGNSSLDEAVNVIEVNAVDFAVGGFDKKFIGLNVENDGAIQFGTKLMIVLSAELVDGAGG